MGLKVLRVVKSGQGVAVMIDPVLEFEKIRGPWRQAWWVCWVSLGVWLFRSNWLGSGRWSPAWVFGNLSIAVARLERFTRR